MAFNLKEMSIDYRSLLRMVPTDRTAAAQSGLINDIIGALTPGQIVNLFPRYYRQQLPDVGSVNRYRSGLDVALSGGTNLRYRNNNSDYPEGPNLDQMKAKLVEKGINVQGIYDTVGNGVLKNDPRVKFLNTLPPDKLAELGFEEFQDENGKTLIKAQPITVPEDVANGKGIGSVGNGMDLPVGRRKELVFNAVLGQLKADGFEAVDIRGVAALLAGQPEQESGYNPTAQHDKNPRTGEYTGYGIYGARNERRDKMFAWLAQNGYQKDDLIGQARYMAHEAVTDYKDVIGKVSGLELTKIAKENPAQFREIMLDFVGGPGDKGFESPAVPTSGLENRIRGATDTFDMREENVIAMNKETYTAYMNRQREDKLSRELYNAGYAPTATPISTTGIMNPVGGSQEGTSILDPNAVPRSGGAPGSRSFGGPRAGGKYHTGVDLPGQVGDPVRAPADGTVRQVYKSGSGYGYVMDIEFPDGTVHRYAHLGTDTGGAESAFAKGPDGKPLKAGDKIKSGQTFGFVGESGNAGYEFPHVHMEVIKKDYYEATGGRPPGREETRESLEQGRIDPFVWYKQQEERLKKIEEEKAKVEAAKTQPMSVPVSPPAPTTPMMTSPVSSSLSAPVVNPESITPKPPPVMSSPESAATQNQTTMQPAPPKPVTQVAPPVNPNTFTDMAGGSMNLTPSQVRAYNTARLYNPQSGSLYNGHFA